jgi:hypothetical protein
MATPSIQTLITQAQQVLNLKSTNEIRATLAAVLANANVGTPLNPNLTTQQLWDEFYEIVRQPSDDIMSIVVDQMMRMVFSPPAPGGAGADKQVIFNDGGVLAGDSKFLWDKTANRLDIDGPLVVTGDLTVDTSTLKVDSANDRVGIQSTLLNSRLTVRAGTIAGIDIYRDDSNANFSGIRFKGTTNSTVNAQIGWNGTQIRIDGTDEVLLVTNSSDRFRITTGGVFTWENVGGVAGTAMTLNSTGLGIGASPGVKLDVLSASAEGTIRLTSTIDGSTASPKGSSLSFRSGSSSTETARIASFNRFANVNGGDLVFSTADSSQVLQTRATIDSSGNLLVGVTATPSGTIGGGAFISDSNSRKQLYLATTSTSSQVLAIFLNPNGIVGTIETNGSTTAYNTSSDYRLKESVKPLSGLARVNALKPSVYKWKVDGSAGEGFLAHELAEVVPFAVSGEKDAVDADGKPTYQGVDLSKLVPILVAAIQELTARVQTLEAR